MRDVRLISKYEGNGRGHWRSPYTAPGLNLAGENTTYLQRLVTTNPAGGFTGFFPYAVDLQQMHELHFRVRQITISSLDISSVAYWRHDGSNNLSATIDNPFNTGDRLLIDRWPGIKISDSIAGPPDTLIGLMVGFPDHFAAYDLADPFPYRPSGEMPVPCLGYMFPTFPNAPRVGIDSPSQNIFEEVPGCHFFGGEQHPFFLFEFWANAAGIGNTFYSTFPDYDLGGGVYVDVAGSLNAFEWGDIPVYGYAANAGAWAALSGDITIDYSEWFPCGVAGLGAAWDTATGVQLRPVGYN